jgi:hypothetical protein
MFLFGAALGADPVIRQVLEGGTSVDAVIRITNFRVIHIAAGALIFLHVISFASRFYTVYWGNGPVPLWFVMIIIPENFCKKNVHKHS